MQPVEIMNRLIGVSAASLTPKQRQVQLVMDFDTETCNGGWGQYLYNSSGDGAEEFRALSKALGYNGIAEALNLIAELMGGRIPEDRSERITALNSLKGGLSEADEDRICLLIEQNLNSLFDDNCSFITAHMSEFESGDDTFGKTTDVE